MLILTRSPKQGKNEILIGDDVRIIVRGLDRGQVSIAIDAPKEIVILRGEVEDNGKRR